MAKKRKSKKDLANDDWWAEELRYRPNSTKRELSNSIRIRDPLRPSLTHFKVNSIANAIECIRTLAKRVNNRQRTFVIFLEEPDSDLFEEVVKARPEN